MQAQLTIKSSDTTTVMLSCYYSCQEDNIYYEMIGLC